MTTDGGNTGEDVVRLTQLLVAEAERVADAFVAAQGMHTTDMEALLGVLAAEQREAVMTAGALGRELRLTTGSVTAVVDRLEGAGALRRVRDQSDRRKVLLATTPQGRALAQEYAGPVRARIDEVLAQFSGEQLDVVSRYLAATAAAMAAHHRALTARGAAAEAPRP